MGVRWFAVNDYNAACVGPMRLIVQDRTHAWGWSMRFDNESGVSGNAPSEAEARTLAENAARAMLDRWRAELGEVDG